MTALSLSQELLSHYKAGGERSVEESARIVGLRLPEQIKEEPISEHCSSHNQ